MKLLQLHPVIKNGPACFNNFYLYHMANGAEFKGEIPDEDVFNDLLATEPCKVELVKTFKTSWSVNGWALRFATNDDYTAFMLRWS